MLYSGKAGPAQVNEAAQPGAEDVLFEINQKVRLFPVDRMVPGLMLR
jgi:hypothetical protein